MALALSTSTFLFDNRGTVALFSPMEVPQIQLSTARWTFLFGNRDTMAFSRQWRCLRFFVDSIHQFQERVSERVVEQIVDLAVPPRLASAGLAHRRAPPCRECGWCWRSLMSEGNRGAQARCLPIADRARLILAKLRLPALGAVLTVFSEKD